MQPRLTAVVVEDAGNSGRAAAAPRSAPVKREWPFKITNILLFLILLGSGVLLGVVASLHVMGYFQGTVFSDPCPPRYPISVVSSNGGKQDWTGGALMSHSMSDEELLWRASVFPLRPGIPIQRTPKVAFMFLTKGALYLYPLWEKYFEGYSDLFSIYVHATPGFSLDVPSSSVFHGRQIPSQEAHWGEISMCDAERRLLGNALLDYSNEWFILLSETCGPIFNFTSFYQHVKESQHSFVGAFDDHGPFGRGRYDPRMQPEVTLEQWRKGSQWFEVTRKHAIYIVSDSRYYNKFRDFCRPNCYVDEHYVPTMMSIEFGAEIASRSLTSVDWSRGGSHPAMFGKNDISEAFLQRIRDDRKCSYNGVVGQHPCYFFSRKFAPDTLEPLLRLWPGFLSTS